MNKILKLFSQNKTFWILILTSFVVMLLGVIAKHYTPS